MENQNSQITGIMKEADQYYQELLGYTPNETQLEIVPESTWENYARKIGHDQQSGGMYLPRNNTAAVRGDNSLSLFHEYYGHGLFFEHAQIGHELTRLEQQLFKEEQETFDGQTFSLKDLNRFRTDNQTYQQLQALQSQNLAAMELYAIHAEYTLAGLNGITDSFEKKYSEREEQREQLEQLLNHEKRYGTLATHYTYGLAHENSPSRVETLLTDLYGPSIQEAELVLLYGSRKPHSDIDVFIIDEKDNIRNREEHWLDVRIHNPNEVNLKVDFLDIAVTDPLLTGTPLYGTDEFHESLKHSIDQIPITPATISYNQLRAEEQKRYAIEHPENSAYREKGLAYAESYSLTSKALQGNRKLLTRENLHAYAAEQKGEMQ